MTDPEADRLSQIKARHKEWLDSCWYDGEPVHDIGYLLSLVEQFQQSAKRDHDHEACIKDMEQAFDEALDQTLTRAETAEEASARLRTALEQLVAGVTVLLDGLADQQAIPDDSWRYKWTILREAALGEPDGRPDQS